MSPGTPFILWSLVLSAVAPGPATGQTPPYPPSPIISSATFDFSTHVRLAPGSDNWPLTWADDDHQYTSWGDGGGFVGDDSRCRVGLGFGRLEGPADGFVGYDISGDPACADYPSQFGGKTRTVISIDGTLYFWESPGSDVSGLDYQRLHRSTDHAATWTNTGVEWTYGSHRIGLFAFLQFGKDYQGARDGYVYIYATGIQSYTWGTQKPGALFLLRVPKAQIENQSQYQFFRGLDGSGNPLWGTHAQRTPVLVDPNGLMRNSAIYNPGLSRYLVVTNHTQNNSGNIAVFDAPEPWGPWTTALYESGWPKGGEVERNVFFANFSPKWWTEGGRKFVFIFTGKSSNDSFNSVEGAFQLTEADTQPKTTKPGARATGDSEQTAAQAPPVQVLVTRLTPEPGRFVYRYTVVNGGTFPITSVIVGNGYYYGDELAYAPMGWDGSTVPASSYKSPPGWNFRNMATDEDSVGRSSLREWSLDGLPRQCRGATLLGWASAERRFGRARL